MDEKMHVDTTLTTGCSSAYQSKVSGQIHPVDLCEAARNSDEIILAAA